MTRKKDSANRGRRSKWLRQWLEQDGDRLKELLKAALEEVLEAEMEETLQAAKGERTPRRLGYRAGYSSRSLVRRVGKIELRVPQDREGRFRTELFERYQRSEKAWVAALVEMYVAGVSTRKVKGITEELCGHEFSSGTISRLVGRLDEELGKFAGRRLEEEYPYLVLDARYERVREDGAVRSQAVLVAVGVNWEGRRSVLGVELAERESATAWREFLVGLRERGLRGVVLVVSDDHAGLRRAIQEVLPEALWQRCYVHFLRNALDCLPRKADDDCLVELRWIYERRDLGEARRDLAAWLGKWWPRYAKLCAWVEENIEADAERYRLPREHHRHLKSTNMLERLMEEIKRRTLVVRIFPKGAAWLGLIRALAVEMHEEWMEGARYLNMQPLADARREAERGVGEAA